MESNGDWLQGLHQPEDVSGPVNENATGGRHDNLAPTEVMDLAFEVTRSSAAIYELVADLARSLAEPPQDNLLVRRLPFDQHFDALRKITSANENSQRQILQLESKIVSIQPEIFDAFLNDCWAALVVFKEIIGNLAGIIGMDEYSLPTATAVEALIKIMARLETCSEKVYGLPRVGMAVSYQCLVEAAFDLQRHADGLEGSVSIS